MSAALWVIRDEHARYGSVLSLVRGLLADAGGDPAALDAGLIALALDYVAEFVATFHHPKEDRFLFRLVRMRAPEAAALVEALERDHVEGDRRLTALRVRLEALQRRPTPELFGRFKSDAMAYLDFETGHALRESRELLPIAQGALTAEDWAEVDAAFADNDDPAFGARPQQRFDRMLSAIVNRAPAPHGLGPTPTIGARWPLP